MSNRSGLTKLPGACQHWHMARGAYQIRDIRDPVIRVYCPECHRFAQFGRAGLVERFGPDQPMPTLLRILSTALGVPLTSRRAFVSIDFEADLHPVPRLTSTHS